VFHAYSTFNTDILDRFFFRFVYTMRCMYFYYIFALLKIFSSTRFCCCCASLHKSLGFYKFSDLFVDKKKRKVTQKRRHKRCLLGRRRRQRRRQNRSKITLYFCLSAFIVGFSSISLKYRSDLRHPREYSHFVSLFLTVRT
jgi:hypothetical protein